MYLSQAWNEVLIGMWHGSGCMNAIPNIADDDDDDQPDPIKAFS